jgi:membrane protein implicated in regulation of membrane protease activity
MLLLLSEQILWWHWIIFGILLLTLDIFIGTFMILGFGLAAIMVGVVSAFYPISIEVALGILILLSIVNIIIWFRYIKGNKKESLGDSSYSLEAQGVVTKDIYKNDRGEVHFDTPVLGNSIWSAISKEDLPKDSRVKIVEIKAQLIEVCKIE